MRNGVFQGKPSSLPKIAAALQRWLCVTFSGRLCTVVNMYYRSSTGIDTPGGILIGNSKAVWEPFCSFMNANKDNPQFARNPFDNYTEACVNTGIERVGKRMHRENWCRNTRFSHSTGDDFVHIQLACKLSEFAYLNPICHLNVHEELGPWFALRAVVSGGALYHQPGSELGMLMRTVPKEQTVDVAEMLFLRS